MRLWKKRVTKDDLITLREVKRLPLKDGDTLVLLADKPMSPDMIRHLQHEVASRFPNNRAMVLDAGFDIAVLEDLPETAHTTAHDHSEKPS